MISMKGNDDIYVANAYRIIITLALAMHVMFAGVFFILHMGGMVWYNLGIGVFYAVLLFIAQKKAYRLVVILTHMEVSCFVIVSTLTLGWNYGFWIYLVALSSLIYFNPFRVRKIIYLFPVIEFSVLFLLRIITVSQHMLSGTHTRTAEGFYYFNFTGCFVVLMLGAYVSRVSLNTMRQERDRIAYDSLTGVFCREYFIQKVEQTLHAGPEEKYYLLLTNILGFKYYNEIFGEARGDEVLIAQADMLRQEDDFFIWHGRVSGNEFGALISKEKYDEKKLTELISQLQDRFTNEHYWMHIHVGVYCVQDRDESVSIMLGKAKMAIEALQREYSACVAYYDSGMLEKSLQEKRILGEFEHALEDGQFCFYLQPQVRKDGTCFGAEALVRWKHPERGLVPPAEFIPILENTGLIWRLDKYIWEQVVKKLKQWRELGREDICISVNMSARDFYYLDLCDTFSSLCEKYQVSPNRLKLELTETALMTEVESQVKLLKELRDYGFEIEIDDFGSGYSSLNMLKDIQADILKIDMAFLHESEHNPRSWSILQSIVELAKTIGMDTITEGVETGEQMSNLADMGCNKFQGYYFSRPLPVEEFESTYL